MNYLPSTNISKSKTSERLPLFTPYKLNQILLIALLKPKLGRKVKGVDFNMTEMNLLDSTAINHNFVQFCGWM